MKNYPKKDDVITADAEPHAVHEMGGHNGHNPRQGNIRRHYVVMSTNDYNRATHMFIGMPITTSNYSNNPKYKPILLNGSHGTGVKGYIVLWQLQNFDFDARSGVIVNHIDPRTLDELQQYVNDMVGNN